MVIEFCLGLFGFGLARVKTFGGTSNQLWLVWEGSSWSGLMKLGLVGSGFVGIGHVSPG